MGLSCGVKARSPRARSPAPPAGQTRALARPPYVPAGTYAWVCCPAAAHSSASGATRQCGTISAGSTDPAVRCSASLGLVLAAHFPRACARMAVLLRLLNTIN